MYHNQFPLKFLARGPAESRCSESLITHLLATLVGGHFTATETFWALPHIFVSVNFLPNSNWSKLPRRRVDLHTSVSRSSILETLVMLNRHKALPSLSVVATLRGPDST